MATQFDTLEDPEFLTLYARDLIAALAEGDGLAPWAPISFIEDVEFTIESLVNLGIPVGELRPFNTPAKLINRQFGASSKVVSIAPISAAREMSEFDRIRQKANADNELIQQVYSDVEQTVRAVWVRARLLTGEAMSTAKIALAEGGVVQDPIDFGDNASRKKTAGTVWSNNAADAWTDYAVACQEYEDLNGFPPSVGLADTTTLREFRATAEVQANTNMTGQSRTINLEALNDTLQADGLAPLAAFNEKIGSSPILTAGVVHLMPPTNLDAPSARRVFGITAAAGTTVDLQGSAQAGVTVYQKVDTNPIRIETVADALFMPAVVANHFYAMTV